MSNLSLFSVDGVTLPNPSKYDPTFKDLDSSNSYTSETGILNRDMIRGNHRTWDVEWTKLTFKQLQTILKAISADDTSKESFKLKYLDLYSGEMKTGKFYATDRAVTTKRIRSLNNGMFALSVQFIEF